MKTLLIVLGALAFAAVGSAVVWKLADDGGVRRVGAIGEDEPLKEGPSGALRWRGTFNQELAYKTMDVVSHEGSSWIATEDMEKAQAPPKGAWGLVAQGGQQAAAAAFNGTFQSPNGSYSLVVSDNGIFMEGPGGKVNLNSNGLTLEGEGPVTVKAGGNLQLSVGQNFTTSVASSVDLNVGKNLSTNVGQNVVTSAGGAGNLTFAKTFMWNIGQDFTLISDRAINVKAKTSLTADADAQVHVRGSTIRLNCGGSATAKPVARQSDQVVVQSPSSSGQISQGSATVLAC